MNTSLFIYFSNEELLTLNIQLLALKKYINDVLYSALITTQLSFNIFKKE